MSSLFTAEDLKSYPLHIKSKFSHYESEWQEFEKLHPNATPIETYLFRQKLSENGVNRKTRRSLISPTFANRFIREFILEPEQP